MCKEDGQTDDGQSDISEVLICFVYAHAKFKVTWICRQTEGQNDSYKWNTLTLFKTPLFSVTKF